MTEPKFGYIRPITDDRRWRAELNKASGLVQTNMLSILKKQQAKDTQ